MSEKYLLNSLPPKFIGITKVAIKNEIARHTALRNDDNTPDEVLAEFDYGNDTWILQMVLDDMSNPHQTVVGDLYVLSQNVDGTEATLQLFGKPIPIGETVKWVFLAADFDTACAIKNRLMGFKPYKPMPTNIAMSEHHVLKKNKERYALAVIIYQAQNFGGFWQCDYHVCCDVPDFDNIHQTAYAKDGLRALKYAIQGTEFYLKELKKQGFKILPNQCLEKNQN